MLPAGFPTLSQKNAQVLSSTSFSIALPLDRSRQIERDPELRQDVREQRMRRAVELRDGDDVLAVARHVQHRVVQSGLPAADCERADAAF